MNSFLLHFLLLSKPLGYFLIFMGMTFEGDAVLFTIAFLAHQGFFDIGDTLFFLLTGVLFGDLLWYWVGHQFGASHFFLIRWMERFTKPFEHHLTQRPFHTIFLSKFVYGFHHPLLLRAGALHLELKNFIRIDFVASCAWIVIVGGIGYFSSASLVLIRHYLKSIEIALLLALLAFSFFSHLVADYMKRRL